MLIAASSFVGSWTLWHFPNPGIAPCLKGDGSRKPVPPFASAMQNAGRMRVVSTSIEPFGSDGNRDSMPPHRYIRDQCRSTKAHPPARNPVAGTGAAATTLHWPRPWSPWRLPSSPARSRPGPGLDAGKTRWLASQVQTLHAIIRPCRSGGMVDAADSKSAGGDIVGVRVPPSVPDSKRPAIARGPFLCR